MSILFYILINCFIKFYPVFSKWVHPHSTYALRGRRGVKPNAYDCVQGEGEGEFQGFFSTQKKILNHKISKFFFFCTKEAITFHYYCV